MTFYESRLQTCSACPNYRPMLFNKGQCTACGCIIELKALIPWARCPENRWLELDPADQAYRDILINDAYHALQNPHNAYSQAVLTKFKTEFPGADLAVLYDNLVNRRSAEQT